MFIYYDKNLTIRIISKTPIYIKNMKCIEVQNMSSDKIGKRMPSNLLSEFDFIKKEISQLRVAIVCNWNDKCGISTYSKYLIDEIIKITPTVKIFSESKENNQTNTELEIEKCWERGKCLLSLADKILEWAPDYIIVQHEYGIFPNAFYWMQLMEKIKHVPHVVTLHSVYANHLDKTVYNESIRNFVVHSDKAKESLIKSGNSGNIFVVPHGCLNLSDTAELWNIYANPYTVMQFGFGFAYKGVDRALNAISFLKNNDPKFENIFYIFLCSLNQHNNNINYEYYNNIISLAKELGIEKNVAIVHKYQSDQMINLYLRLAKLAIFPYTVDKENQVYSASGAIRIAMANHRPVIASESGHFDDLEGIVPRPSNHIELAREIDEIFSNNEYRNKIVNQCQKFISDNNWNNIAIKYLDIYNKIIDNRI